MEERAGSRETERENGERGDREAVVYGEGGGVVEGRVTAGDGKGAPFSVRGRNAGKKREEDGRDTQREDDGRGRETEREDGGKGRETEREDGGRRGGRMAGDGQGGRWETDREEGGRRGGSRTFVYEVSGSGDRLSVRRDGSLLSAAIVTPSAPPPSLYNL